MGLFKFLERILLGQKLMSQNKTLLSPAQRCRQKAKNRSGENGETDTSWKGEIPAFLWDNYTHRGEKISSGDDVSQYFLFLKENPIISHCLCISNRYVVHLKVIQCCMSIISQLKKQTNITSSLVKIYLSWVFCLFIIGTSVQLRYANQDVFLK